MKDELANEIRLVLSQLIVKDEDINGHRKSDVIAERVRAYEKRKIEAISKYDPKIEKVMMYLIDNKYISTEVYVKLSDVLKELGI